MQPRSELLMKESSGQCNEAKPSFSERGGTAPAVGDSRRVWLIGKTPQRSAQLIGRAVQRRHTQACKVLSQATKFSILHRKRSPSFHMEGG